eukprot:m.13537 g.13537  ORF g.13537 m.13537 type:complete len:177 (-) comp3310_c0_seq1:231-761(-)
MSTGESPSRCYVGEFEFRESATPEHADSGAWSVQDSESDPPVDITSVAPLLFRIERGEKILPSTAAAPGSEPPPAPTPSAPGDNASAASTCLLPSQPSSSATEAAAAPDAPPARKASARTAAFAFDEDDASSPSRSRQRVDARTGTHGRSLLRPGVRHKKKVVANMAGLDWRTHNT